MLGLPSSIVHEFVNYDGVIDDKDVSSCKGEGCRKTTKSRVGASFPASGWVDHIVYRCSDVSQQQKEGVAIACKTKKTQQWLEDLEQSRRNSESQPSYISPPQPTTVQFTLATDLHTHNPSTNSNHPSTKRQRQTAL